MVACTAHEGTTWDRIHFVRRHEWGWAAIVVMLCAGCRPSTVADAEAKGDVAWLDAKGTPEALAALGRLADKNPKAVVAIESRMAYDPTAYALAWSATVRGAAWGTTTLKKALGDPSRAEAAAAAMSRKDPHLAQFVTELEGALVRLAASQQNAAVATGLASVGAPAKDAVERRLADGSTRGAMCRGISSTDASGEARKSLTLVSPASRDNGYCVDAVIKIASEDDDLLAWLATSGEPGIVGAAGKNELMTCGRLHTLWGKALAERAPEVYSALLVPLSNALKRCPKELDGVLADAITRLPATHFVVVGAIDAFGSYGGNLKATCAALPIVAANMKAPGVTRERARDALAHSCTMR